MVMMCIVLQLLIVAFVQHFKLLFYRRSLPPTDGARTGMLLLLLHLAHDGLLLDLQERLALVLAQAEPEVLDVLPLLLGARVPDALAADMLHRGGMAMAMAGYTWRNGYLRGGHVVSEELRIVGGMHVVRIALLLLILAHS